jgi:hypothetical protein
LETGAQKFSAKALDAVKETVRFTILWHLRNPASQSSNPFKAYSVSNSSFPAGLSNLFKAYSISNPSFPAGQLLHFNHRSHYIERQLDVRLLNETKKGMEEREVPHPCSS